MENQIQEGIAKLVSGQITVFVLCFALIAAAIVLIVLALKFRLFSVKSKLPLVLAVFLCSALLISARIIKAVPILQDQRDGSYTVAEGVTLVVHEGTTGIIDRTNNVTLTDAEGRKTELRIEAGSGLVAGVEYIGKVAYTDRSGYVVWSDLTERPLTENGTEAGG